MAVEVDPDHPGEQAPEARCLTQDTANSLLRALRKIIRRNERRLPLLAALLGILLALPSLWVGFAVDDLFFLMTFKGTPGMEGLDQPIWNTFSFSEGNPERNLLRMEHGIMPWWAVEGWKVDLWRPLASLTHWFDYQIFDERPFPMHVHSLLWYGILCFTAAILYRRMGLGSWAWGLAALLFAVDGGHGVAVGWLSNRHALISTLFGVLTLLAHHHWRQQKWGLSQARDERSGLSPFLRSPTPTTPTRQESENQDYTKRGTSHAKGAILFRASEFASSNRMVFPFLSLTALTLALFSGEAAVAVGGYLFAYSLFLDPWVIRKNETPNLRENRPAATLLRAVGILTPYLLVVVIWRTIYTALGHGVHGSWLYIDPLREFGPFLYQAVQRLPVLLVGVFGIPDSTLWTILPVPLQLAYSSIAAALVAFATWVLWPLLRSNATARFFALGATLSAIPFCAAVPSDRNLTYSSIGAMALVALCITRYADGAPWRTSGNSASRGTRILVSAFVLAHLIVAPILLVGESYIVEPISRVFLSVNASAFPGGPAPQEKYIVINTPLDMLGASLPIGQSGRGLAVPKNWWWLSATNRPVEVERIDERTIVLRPDGGFLRRPWAQIFRRPETHPMRAGHRVQLDGMQATVISATEVGRPLEVEFRFDEVLEDPSLNWLTWAHGRYVPFVLPQPGATVRTTALDPMNVLRLAFGMEPEVPGAKKSLTQAKRGTRHAEGEVPFLARERSTQPKGN